MLLRSLLLCTIFGISLQLGASVYTIPGHNSNTYQEDIQVLQLKLTEDPSNLDYRAQLIRFYYVTEQFDEAVKQSGIYKQQIAEYRLKPSMAQEIAYINILSLASASRYQEASIAVDEYIIEYSPSEEEQKQLRHRQQIYQRASATRSAPSSDYTIGENYTVLGAVPGSDTCLVYSRLSGSIEARTSYGKKVSLPSIPDVKDPGEVLNIALNRQNTLCLISVRTKKGAKIVVSFRENGSWSSSKSEPVFSKGAINSFPAFFPDGDAVLFCSNRGNSSGIDVYYSSLAGGSWSEPEKVEGINTQKDEPSVSIHPSGNVVYFSSNGRDGLGGFDMYKGSIDRLSTGGVNVSGIYNMESLNTFKNEVFPVYVTDHGEKGLFSSTDANRLSVILVADRDLAIATNGSAESIHTGTFIASNIEFDTDSARLRRSSYTYLSQLFTYLQEHSSSSITITGYTDNTGSVEYNNRLSLARAQSVKDYLVRRGISADRINVRGMGVTKPAASNETYGGRQKNRRVEITIEDD